MNKPIIRLIKQNVYCERCKRKTKVFKTLKRLYEYSYLFTCKCGCKKVLVSNL